MKKSMTFILISTLLIFPSAFAAATVSAAQGYVIGDEDVLKISVWGNPELTVDVPVRPDGMISVPLAGDVKASGATPQELKTYLEKELAKFVKAPTVSVMVTAVNSFKVYVLGEGVAGTGGGQSGTGGGQSGGASSGVITLRRNTTLMQFLALLGPLTNADLNGAYVLRNGKKLDASLYKLKVKGDIALDIDLKPNDIIFIPDNYEKRIKIVGAVRTPMVLPFREGMTVLDAVLQAGGFTEFAKQNDVVIVRKEGREVRNIEARLKDLTRDGDVTKDLPLMSGDLIIVKTGVF